MTFCGECKPEARREKPGYLNVLAYVALLVTVACGDSAQTGDTAAPGAPGAGTSTTTPPASGGAAGSKPTGAAASGGPGATAAAGGKASAPTTGMATSPATSGGATSGGSAVTTTPPAAGGAAPAAGAAGAMAGAAGAAAGGATTPPGMFTEMDYHDPGTDEWTLVPEGEVAEKCKMDIAKLKATNLGGYSWAVFRYGQLCYENGTDTATQVFSATKSLGGIVTASVAYLLENAPKMGPGTGKFNDFEMASDWGLSQYRQGMQLAYLGSMTTGSIGLEWGMRSFSYDTVGANGLNNMGVVANTALQKAGAQMGVMNMQDATKRLFDKLGMKTASWDGVTFGTGSSLTLHDMGKLFQVVIHNGVYNKERLIGTDWIYRMTHPAFEDANTSYGEFFWLNHRGNAAGIGGDIASGSNSPDGDACAPAAFWQRYPHKVSGAPDCHATVAGTKCQQMHDTGIMSAQGLGGQFIIGHPGLDLVLTIKNYSGMGGPMGMWEQIRPAIIALDPMYKGDADAFCKAYGSGDYAPDQKVQPTQPPDPP